MMLPHRTILFLAFIPFAALCLAQRPSLPSPPLPSRERRPGGEGFLASVAFSPNGTLVAAGGHRVVTLLDAATGRVLARLTGHAGTVTALAFSPDGRTLAAAGGAPGRSGEVRLWDVSFIRPKGLWAVKQVPTVLNGPGDVV